MTDAERRIVYDLRLFSLARLAASYGARHRAPEPPPREWFDVQPIQPAMMTERQWFWMTGEPARGLSTVGT